DFNYKYIQNKQLTAIQNEKRKKSMAVIGIMASGPVDHLPELDMYQQEVDTWIAADRGALTLIEKGVAVTYALGDFDSVTAEQRKIVQENATYFEAFPVEKDETDLEIAIQK